MAVSLCKHRQEAGYCCEKVMKKQENVLGCCVAPIVDGERSCLPCRLEAQGDVVFATKERQDMGERVCTCRNLGILERVPGQ